MIGHTYTLTSRREWKERGEEKSKSNPNQNFGAHMCHIII